MGDLRIGIQNLPENIQKRIARAWARKWSQQAWIAAIQNAPIGKRKNLVQGIKRRDSRKRTLTRLQSLARSVVIGAKPAYHFHLVIGGTKPRYTTGYGRASRGGILRASLARAQQALGAFKPAYRGVMPKNPFVMKAAAPLMDAAEADLRQLVRRNIERMLKKQSGGGTA
jgi:hypothetical protein